MSLDLILKKENNSYIDTGAETKCLSLWFFFPTFSPPPRHQVGVDFVASYSTDYTTTNGHYPYLYIQYNLLWVYIEHGPPGIHPIWLLVGVENLSHLFFQTTHLLKQTQFQTSNSR